MTLTPDDRSAGPVQSDVANRPTVALPGQRRPHDAGRSPASGRGPVVVIVAANSLWAAVVSMLPVVVVVQALLLVASPDPGTGSTLKYSAAAWLLANGVPLTLGGQPLGLVPLAITAVIAWRLYLAGRNSARATRAHTLIVGAGVGIGYGLVGALAPVLVEDRLLSVSALRAGLTLAVVGAIGATTGAAIGRRQHRRWWRRLPLPVREGIRAGTVAVFVLIAIGAVATGFSIALSGATAAQMLHNYHAGAGGQAGLVLICLVYAPNVAVWASAYLSGPSFTLGGVIQLPVFAGLPEHPLAGAGQLLLLMPVLAGVLAGALMRRRPQTGAMDTVRRLVMAVCAGAAAAAGLACAGYAASGPLGSRLLAHTGEVGWQFPLLAGAGIAVGVVMWTLPAALIRRDRAGA